MDYTSKISKISIRGRIAFVLKCLEIALQKHEINISILNDFTDKLWSFTTTIRFDIWHEQVKEYSPWVILDNQLDVLNDLKFVSPKEADDLKNIYTSLPDFIVKIIDICFWVGCHELYGTIKDFSPTTIDYVVDVINLMKNNNLNIPDIDAFEKYKFSEQKGWGNFFDRNSII